MALINVTINFGYEYFRFIIRSKQSKKPLKDFLNRFDVFSRIFYLDFMGNEKQNNKLLIFFQRCTLFIK